MKTSILLVLSFISLTCHGQINFYDKSINQDLLNKAMKADSAIKANEFGPVHSLIIIEDGKLVFENFYNQWPQDSIHQIQSATKSVIATLLGIAIQEGFIKSINDPISYYYKNFPTDDPLKKEIKIIDLLTQRHGLVWNEGAWEDPSNTWRKVINEGGDWYHKILESAMDTLPGTKFNYSNAAPVLVSGIIQNASKMSIDSFAIKYLFEPLGINKYWFWRGNGGPQHNGMALISLTSRDLAKIGQLYLQDGNWNSQQIISKKFVEEATSSIVKGVGLNGAYKQYDYGYFWWSNPISQNNLKTNVFLARGAGGQNIIVDKNNKIIIVTTAWNMQQPNKVQLIYDWYLHD